MRSCSLHPTLRVSLFLLLLVSAQCKPWTYEVWKFLDNNGLKYVTLLENSTTSTVFRREISLKAYKTSNLYLRQSKIQAYAQHAVFDIDAQIFLFDSRHDDISYFLRTIKTTKVKSSVLLLIKPLTKSEESQFQNLLKDTPDMLFYLATLSHEQSSTSWKQVVTILSGYTINELKFKRDSYKILEEYNLHGLKLSSIVPPWAPFLHMEECDTDRVNCTKQFGYLKDYMDALAIDLNFTYESYREPG